MLWLSSGVISCRQAGRQASTVKLTGSICKSSLPRNRISVCVFGVIEDGAAAAAVSRGKSGHTECALFVHRAVEDRWEGEEGKEDVMFDPRVITVVVFVFKRALGFVTLASGPVKSKAS